MELIFSFVKSFILAKINGYLIMHLNISLIGFFNRIPEESVELKLELYNLAN